MTAVWHCKLRPTDVWINKNGKNSYEGLAGLAVDRYVTKER